MIELQILGLTMLYIAYDTMKGISSPYLQPFRYRLVLVYHFGGIALVIFGVLAK